MSFGLVTALCCAFISQPQPAAMQTGGTIVQFTAKWCQPCQQIKPAVNSLANEGWEIKVVDVDIDRQTAELFRVQNLPTLVFVVNGREVDRVVGAASEAALKRRAARVAPRFAPSSHASQALTSPQPNASQAVAHRGVAPLANGSAANVPAANPQPIVRGQGQPIARAASVASNSFLDDQPRQPVRSASAAAPVETRLPLQQAIRRARLATVRIRVDEQNTTAYGTGTVVDVHGDEALVLTCGHLFRHMTQGSQLTIDLYTDAGFQTLPAVLIDFRAPDEDSGSLTEDIGLVSFKTPIPIEPVPILPAAEAVQKGLQVFSWGCDHGDDPTRQDTLVTRINRYVGAANIEIDGAPAVGRSGGGLFDHYGRLVGVCNGAQPEDNEGIYAATEVVYNQVRRLGLDRLFDATVEPSQVQLASASEPARASISASSSLGRGASNPAGRWPSESQIASTLQLAGSNAQASTQPAAPTAQQSSGSMTCRIVDSTGVERVVTINNPDPALVSAIEDHARR